MKPTTRQGICEVAAFVVLLILATWIVCALSGCGASSGADGPTERANGQPLDAISYEPPAWLYKCVAQWRVTDRTSGDSWWLLRMSDGELVVLPIEEGGTNG